MCACRSLHIYCFSYVTATATALPSCSIGLTATSSFRELEPSWREALARLHDEHFFK